MYVWSHSAFYIYIKDLNSFDDNDKEIIVKNEALIKKWVQDLYWEIAEETRDESDVDTNRKIFLYPENWSEPELRDDKSPFFVFLENELLQRNITDDYSAPLEEETEHKLYCKYWGSKLAESQTICNVCGKMVI